MPHADRPSSPRSRRPRAQGRLRVSAVGLTVTVVAALALPAAPTSAARTPASWALPGAAVLVPAGKPVQTIPSLDLGPAPQRCFPLGSSDNICKPVINGTTNPNWPYAPNDNYLNSTYYGQLSIENHLVKPGQDVSASAATALNGTIGWSTPPGPVVSGCQGQDPNCLWKAGGITGGWAQWHISFNGFFGTGDSADYYAIDQKTAISGTFMGIDGEPFADAAVQIAGPTSGTAVTDGSGFYSAVVEAGDYTVSATATEDGVSLTGRASYCAKGTKSATSCSISVGDNDGTANFTAGQEVSGTIADGGTPEGSITVELTGNRDNGAPVAEKTTTDKQGQYSFTPPPGHYKLAPQVPSSDTTVADGFAAHGCPGQAQDGTCQLALAPGATATVNFAFGCGLEKVQLQKVETLVDTDFGAVPYSTVQLLGQGFCPGMKVDFGNTLAEAVIDLAKNPDAISKDGTVAQVVVPRLATSGTVTIVSNGRHAHLDDVPIDSFRNVYGWRFENPDGTLTEAEFLHVFPSAAVTIPYNACPPANCPGHTTALSWQAAQAFAAIAAEFAGGDCFGLALGAARLAPNGDLDGQWDDLQPGAKDTWDVGLGFTGNVDNPGPVFDFVNQLQLVQWSTQEVSLEKQVALGPHQTGAQIMAQVNGDINNDPASSGEYSGSALIEIDHWARVLAPKLHWESEGHAVLAYNVQNDTGPSYWALDVYDPNQPYDAAEDNDANLHRNKANSSRLYVFPNGTWSFPALGWTGGTGTITVVSPAQVVAAIKGGLTFSNPTGVNTLPGQGTVIAAVTAPDGHQVDLAGGGSDGVEVTPVVTGATVPGPVRFSGPPGTYSERITGSGALSETFDTSGYQVSVNASAGTDEVALDTSTGTISIGPAATGKASTTASLTVDQDTANGGVESATLTGSPAAGSIVLGFTGSGQATVTGSAHRARSLSLALANDVTGQAPQAFAAPLVVPGGDTATVEAPEWSSYTGGSLEAAVGPSGKATKEMTLANHSRPPVEPRVSRLSVSGKALFVSVSLPPLPPGSTVQVTTSFLSQEKKVEHKVTTSLAHLGHASARALRVPIPHHLLAGSTATATLIAVPAGASEVLTSSLSTRLAPHA